MESPGALPSWGLVFQLVCHFHRYWAYHSKSTVRPKMQSCFKLEPVLFPPSEVLNFNYWTTKEVPGEGFYSSGLRVQLLIRIRVYKGPCLVTQSYLTFCNRMLCSMPGFPVPHHLLELAQSHVPWVSDAIQPSRPLSSPPSPTFNLFWHQDLS